VERKSDEEDAVETEGTVLESRYLVRWGHGPFVEFDSAAQINADLPKSHIETAEVYRVVTESYPVPVKDGVVVG